MKKILLSVGIVLLASLGVYTVATHKYTSEPTKTATVTSVKATAPTVSELLELVNAERAKVGVKPLVLDERLNQSAQSKADDMVKDGYYAHVNPKTGVRGSITAYNAVDGCTESDENLAGSDSSIEAVREWVASKPHYAGMTNTIYTVTGFGIANQGNYYYLVEHFCN